ncbi:hypothetical protein EUX98_g2914 [Antrodiella citrinella]|uniref:DNA polymerase epsilon subunit D n=1 Tax=Antrodiella citrinella TaxID=2447956 RepID=A0A4S4MXU2_9APHY|nr:hypothetical protein EUX98_g2914 [Antrodiella citrinella]
MPRKEPTTAAAAPSTFPSAQAQQEFASDGLETYELPKSLVTRIARSAFPDNVKLQKEAMLALLKGSTVFVNYIAATAHDVAASKQHKSVSASDVLKALELTQFGDMVDKLQDELQAYRDLQKADKSKKSSAKGKAKETDATSTSTAKGKQKAIIVIPGPRSASAQLPLPSSEPEPDDGDETEDDVRLVGELSEGGEEEVLKPEQEDVDDEIEDEEVEDEDEDEDVAESMDVEDPGPTQEAKEIKGVALSQDQDTDMQA